MSRSGTKRGRVLIVDDQRLNVQLLTDILEDQYDISVAVDGERAVELCARRPPDLVLLDVQMPGLDGYEVDRKSTRLNSSHSQISYAVFCLKKKKTALHQSEQR